MPAEYCSRGSLYEILKAAKASPDLGRELDWERRLGMALDAAQVGCQCLIMALYGMGYVSGMSSLKFQLLPGARESNHVALSLQAMQP